MSKIKVISKIRKRETKKLVPWAPAVRARGTVFEVNSYSYTIHTPGRPDYLLFDDGGLLKVRGVIDCVGDGYHAYVIALADDSQFPLNRYFPSDKTVWIFCRGEQFMWHIDMLRNEKPVYCFAGPDGGCSLSTGNMEPVGEGES